MEVQKVKVFGYLKILLGFTKTFSFKEKGRGMGQIRTKDIKTLARDIYEAYPERCSADFEGNKKLVDEFKIKEQKSKIFRNKVAGYIVRVVKTRQRRGV